MKFLQILKFIFLGFIQGITEILPISSSGHFLIISKILNVSNEQVTFSVFLHLASLFAVVIYLRKELIKLIKGFVLYIFKDKELYKNDFLLVIYLVVTTSILVLFTIFIKLIGINNYPLWLVGIFLIVNGIMLKTFGKFIGTKNIYEINIIDAVIIGLFESFGIFGGISRSGVVLCGCNIRKIDKASSAKYAFLLFVPAVIGATILELKNISMLFLEKENIYLYLISFIVAFITTLYAFNYLKKIINKEGITKFSIYCLIVGLITFIYAIVVK